MRARIACGVIAVTLAASALACAPAHDENKTPDSAPVQARPPVTPGAGTTAAAIPAAPFPDTARVSTGATSGATSAVKPPASRPTKPSTPSTNKSADTLEYDRAIDFKPGPGKELPPVDEKKTKKP